jgi:tetratricopeptide (TPR) repeat protein
MLLPVALLASVELVLRLVGAGYSTSFFREVRSDGKEFLENNNAFSLRFFPPELTRCPTGFRIEKTKPAATCRIFILGESAAMGDPQPAFGPGRCMEALLRNRFPAKRFEVINLGITAINSHVILPIARECAQQNGDIWIIYMGNNEMVGPFGAATVFGSRAPPLMAARFDLAIQRTRLGQLCVTLMRKLAGKKVNPSWGGMEMFLQNQVPPDARSRDTVYHNFEANLRDIVRAGLHSRASVILNTMSVNLKDCPPLASISNSNLPAADREQFDALCSEGRALEKQSQFAEAARRFEQAAGIDPHFAEVQFRWAECLLGLASAAARDHFQLACDSDALPFRADSRVNSAIKSVVKDLAGDHLVLCDAEAALAAANPADIAGKETFFEHVHFNFDGSYRLGKLWAEEVERLLPEAAKKGAAAGWLSREACERDLGLSDWNRCLVVESVSGRVNHPPLSSQVNNAARLEELHAEEQRLRSREAEPGAVERTEGEFDDVIKRWPNDPLLHEGYANFLEAVERRQDAITQYRKLTELLPHDFYAALQLGKLLGRQGSLPEAEALLRQAVEARPSLPEGWYELGNLQAAGGKFDLALGDYERAQQLRPRDPLYWFQQGMMFSKLKRRAEAIQRFQEAIRLNPAYWEAHFELGGELAFDEKVPEAKAEFQEAARLKPEHVLAHFNLGVMLAKEGQLDEAAQQFEETIRLDPGNAQAVQYLKQVQMLKSRGQ